mgnify:CR=1 FL=1
MLVYSESRGYADRPVPKQVVHPKPPVGHGLDRPCGMLIVQEGEQWTVRRCRFVGRSGHLEHGSVMSRWSTEQQAEEAARVALALENDRDD